MARNRQYLCLFYGLVATVAFISICIEVVGHFGAVESLSALPAAALHFMTDTQVSRASRTVTVDLLLLSLAAMTFMVLEGRRLGIRFVWAYILFGFLLAISVTFPLFMIARERHLAWQEGGESAPLAATDGLAIGALSAAVVVLSGCVIVG
jgi:hypothetical protein